MQCMPPESSYGAFKSITLWVCTGFTLRASHGAFRRDVNWCDFGFRFKINGDHDLTLKRKIYTTKFWGQIQIWILFA